MSNQLPALVTSPNLSCPVIFLHNECQKEGRPTFFVFFEYGNCVLEYILWILVILQRFRFSYCNSSQLTKIHTQWHKLHQPSPPSLEPYSAQTTFFTTQEVSPYSQDDGIPQCVINLSLKMARYAHFSTHDETCTEKAQSTKRYKLICWYCIQIQLKSPQPLQIKNLHILEIMGYHFIIMIFLRMAHNWHLCTIDKMNIVILDFHAFAFLSCSIIWHFCTLPFSVCSIEMMVVCAGELDLFAVLQYAVCYPLLTQSSIELMYLF